MSPQEELPTTPQAIAKEEVKLRQELAETRRAHALQKLDSPAKLRKLRRRLARILTMKNAKA